MNRKLHNSFVRLRRNRELAELLGYALLYDEQTVLHKDGAFSAHFRYVARDVDSSTGATLDANAHAVLRALGLLEDGWMVETNLISEEDQRRTGPGTFPDTVACLIDDSRRFNFEEQQTFYRSVCHLSISHVATDRFGRRLSGMMMGGEGKPRDRSGREHEFFEGRVGQFLTQFRRITRAQGDSSFTGETGVWRLKGDELVTFLQRTITGDSRRLKVPGVGYFLDSLLASENLVTGVLPKIGDRWIRVLSIDDLPEYSHPAILDELNHLDCEYRWSSRFIPLSRSTADRYLKSLKNRWSNRAIGLMGSIRMAMGMAHQPDEAAEERKCQVADAIRENGSGEVRYGFMTSVVVLMERDRKRLDTVTDGVTRVVEGLDFRIRRETMNATEAWLGSIPGHGGYNLRKPLVDSRYVSHALPISSVWEGSRTATCPFYPPGSAALLRVRTRGSRTFYLNLHVGDVGHFMMIGPTGSGKSTLLGLIGCQFRRYRRSRVIVFDRDHSNRIWLMALGGDYFDLYGGARFSPLACLDGLEVGTVAFEAEMTFMVEWLCEICELQKVDITPDRRGKIASSLRALAASGRENLRLDLLHVQDQAVRQALDAFNSGAIQAMINSSGDRFGGHSVIGMEMGELLKLPPAIHVPIVRSVFHRLTRLFNDRRPTLLVLEEAWSFLRHRIFEKMLEDWLLTLRKFNVAVGFVSQNLRHVTGSRIGDTIRESCPTRIFLPNRAVEDEAILGRYRGMGLNDQQIRIIGRAVPKRDYYLTSPPGNRLFQIDPGLLVLAFIGVSDGVDIRKFMEIHRSNDRRWILDWLEYRGLHGWREHAEDNFFKGKADDD